MRSNAPPETFLHLRPPAAHSQPTTPPAQPIGVQWRPKEPFIFFGRANEDANTWTSIVSNYFAFIQGSPQKEVAYAVTLLRDAAHDWWTAYLLRQGGRMAPNWGSF